MVAHHLFAPPVLIPANVPGRETRRLAPKMSANVELITTLAALIREVDGSHSLGAAELAEALAERGVTMSSPPSRVYAAATLLSDGTVEPVSTSFTTRAEAEHDLAILRGDDYYRDRRPFIATSVVQHWHPVDTASAH